MEDTKHTINYIFYLQTKADLDHNFITLSEILSKLNISLLPITSEDLKVLDRSNKNYLVVMRNDLSSHQQFTQTRKSFIDIGLMSGRMMVFDISSFSEIETAQKLASKEVYRFIALPANLKQIAMTIAVDYFKDRNKREEWPGGKRATLPSMNNQN
jgi:hypothetical protein